jgi:lycopene cyclase domain-containing protein
MEPFAYLSHLLFWILPFLALQWLIGWRIFLANLRAVIWPALLAGGYYSLCDAVAIDSGLWFFGPGKTLGWRLGVVPVEECLFFLLTALLVAQSVVLLLPARMRRQPQPAGRSSGEAEASDQRDPAG